MQEPTAQLPQVHNGHRSQSPLGRRIKTVKLTIARQCSTTPPQGHLGTQSHNTHSQRQVWQGPKVATCEARFCKISAKFGFLEHTWAETRPSKPVQAKAILDKVAKTREITRSSRQRWPHLKHTLAKYLQNPGFKHFWAEARPSKPTQAKATLDQRGQNPRNNETS